MLIFDKWTCHCAIRRPYSSTIAGREISTAVFIDQADCFNGGRRSFTDAPLQGIFSSPFVYSSVTDWIRSALAFPGREVERIDNLGLRTCRT